MQLLEARDNLWGCSVLAAVADGMGGHEDGARASQIAVETVWEVLAARQRDRGEFGEAWRTSSPTDRVARAIRLANSRVHAPRGDDGMARSMGTTLTLLVGRDEEAVIGHVGDSRAYVLAAGELRQATQDHTFVAEAVANGSVTPEEAVDSPFAGQLTRGVGLHAEVVPDAFVLPVRAGMTVILCSDGLTGVLADEDIRAAARSARDMAGLARSLIATAEAREPTDNISVVCLRRSP